MIRLMPAIAQNGEMDPDDKKTKMKLGLAKAVVDRMMRVTASEVRSRFRGCENQRLMVDMLWRTES
jgi:hypothetical protein